MILKSYEINKIDQNINHLILFYGKNEGLKNEAVRILVKKNDNKIYIEANSIYKKIILSKDGAGKVTNYQLEAEVIFIIKPLNKKIIITEKKIIDSMDDKYEEARTERTIKQGFASSISNKLSSEIILN